MGVGAHSEVANMLNGDFLLSEFELQLRYYVHFRTNTLWERMNPLIPTHANYGLNSITAVFHKDGLGIKYPIKVYMPLNKERRCNGYCRREMDTATRVQIMDETDCISHSTNTLGKGMNPIILPPAMVK